MSSPFVHLHLHSEYSIIDGIVRVKPLIEMAVQAGMPAVTITDQCNLFGMVKFYKAAIAAGIKPIIGVDLWLANEQDEKQPFRLLLLCQNKVGYLNLTQLISRAYLEGQEQGIPLIQKEWLRDASEGLIALSGGREGDVGMALLANNTALAKKRLAFWQTTFPTRFYLELQRTGRENEEVYLHAAVELAEQQNTPVVATNDVRFLQSDDFEAHEARVCIHDGYVLDDHRRPHLYTEQQYFRTPEEMAQLFADIPEALEN